MADKEKKGYPKAASARKRPKRFSGAWIIMLVLQFRIASNFLGISTHLLHKNRKKGPKHQQFFTKGGEIYETIHYSWREKNYFRFFMNCEGQKISK